MHDLYKNDNSLNQKTNPFGLIKMDKVNITFIDNCFDD